MSNSKMALNFTYLIHVISSEVQNMTNTSLGYSPDPALKVLRKNHAKIKLVATDLALVGVSLRTSHLVDSISPSDPLRFWSILLQNLRSDTKTRPYFTDVIHVFEPTSEQSFVVKGPLLRRKIQQLLLPSAIVTLGPAVEKGSITGSVLGYPVFVHLEPGFPSSFIPPDEALEVLGYLERELACFESLTKNSESSTSSSYTVTLNLPPNIEAHTAVALAGIMLDYAVAYVPSTDASGAGGKMLANELVDVYECILRYQNGAVEQTHTVMKFSCPVVDADKDEELGSEAESGLEWLGPSPTNIIGRLGGLFDERLRCLSQLTEDLEDGDRGIDPTPTMAVAEEGNDSGVGNSMAVQVRHERVILQHGVAL